MEGTVLRWIFKHYDLAYYIFNFESNTLVMVPFHIFLQ